MRNRVENERSMRDDDIIYYLTITISSFDLPSHISSTTTSHFIIRNNRFKII